MKILLNLTIALCLFSSTILADGDMGNGKQCTPENCPPPTPPPCTVNCGRQVIINDGDTETSDMVLIFVEQFLSTRF